MDALVLVVAVVAVMLSAFAAAGSYVAGVKGRPRAEGAWMGFLLGPIGVVVEALLPSGREPPVGGGRKSGYLADRVAEKEHEARWGSARRDLRRPEP